ncbi:GnsA/GnsB family addiction module toxin [Escherichia coli]
MYNKKIIELKKKTGKEVTSIQFTAREKMTVDLPLYFQTSVIT